MSEFKREERYIVIKRSDFRPNGKQEEALRRFLSETAIPTREAVVVEPHHPHYEETWENVRRVVEGEPTIAEERDAAADYARDQAAVLELLAKALGVPDEPHQGRAERILEAAEGLTARAERLRCLGNLLVKCMNGEGSMDHMFNAIETWEAAEQETPDSSLARLKAESLESILEEKFGTDFPFDAVHAIQGEVARLRRQAEEGDAHD